MEQLNSSTKNVYLLVTDLHKSPRTPANRKNYPKEIKVVENKIDELINQYKSKGYSVNLIWLGDIFHRSYRSPDVSMSDKSDIALLCSKADKCYSVLGNHEETYEKDNPFWHLVKNIKSNKLTNIMSYRNWRPKGTMAFIDIVDRIEDGEVEFLFNHYSTDIIVPTPNKVSIGLFHKPIVFREILDDAKNNNRKMFELSEEEMISEYNYTYLNDDNYLNGYQICYFGHNHLLYGNWNNNGVRYCYLGSLGRTNHIEVQNDFLERTIPAVIVENGKLEDICEHKFTLPNREECVKEEVVIKNKVLYESNKERRKIKEYKGYSDDPIKNIKDSFLGNEYQYHIISNIIETTLEGNNDIIYETLVSNMLKIEGDENNV